MHCLAVLSAARSLEKQSIHTDAADVIDATASEADELDAPVPMGSAWLASCQLHGPRNDNKLEQDEPKKLNADW